MATRRAVVDDGGMAAAERRDVDEMVVGGGGRDEEDVTSSTEPEDLDALLLFSAKATSSAKERPGTTTSVSLTGKDKFSVVCSKKLMRSWVRQPSPCCAAASVAGALNALSAKEPDWTCAQLLEYYKGMTRDRVRRQKRLVQLQTGASDQEIADLEAAVRQHVASSGEFEFGGTKKITQKLLLDGVSTCLKECPSSYPVFHSLLMQNDADSSDSETLASESGGDGELEAREDETKTINTAFEIEFRTGDRSSKLRLKKQLHDSLYQYLHLIDGLAKLERSAKPSTAICGNEAILRAIGAVNESESDMNRLGATGRILHATLFMGKQVSSSASSATTSGSSNRVKWEILPGDSEARHTEAWVGLWREFSRDSTVLIYHLKNHYALVFAMREWLEPASSRAEQDQKEEAPSLPRNLQCREILTARKGQHPSVWIAWDEVYKTLCSWHGYKILSISIE